MSKFSKFLHILGTSEPFMQKDPICQVADGNFFWETEKQFHDVGSNTLLSVDSDS